MGKVKINKHDHLRVLITETLPYEVPINFSNEGAYNYLKEQESNNHYFETNNNTKQFIELFFNYQQYTKPYNYRINKNANSKRLLSIPHPSIQIRISILYKEYDALITDICSRSPVSLRAPSKVASRFYEKELVNTIEKDTKSGVEVDSEAFGKTFAFASSYFSYKKYNFLYKYYDSYESHRIEKKFDKLTRFDISKCFHNIYVPTFGWAVKGREFSKLYSNYYSLESKFQTLMTDANENESSGILIGPEFSRIFAEVILQKIDLVIIKNIKEKLNLNYDTDYTLRRYVDDYFLYTKNKSTSKKILETILLELEKFKLFANESKTEFIDVPFITGLTIAKMDIKELVKNTFSVLVTPPSESTEKHYTIKYINPSRTSNRFIKQLKRLVKENNVNYESLSGNTLSEIRRNFFKVISDREIEDLIITNQTNKLLSFILLIIEISFFIYSMDIRVRTTYIITQIIVKINELISSAQPAFRDDVKKKIYDESVLLLTKLHEKGKANQIETLNLLVSIKTNFEQYPINEKTILNLFDLKVVEENSEKKVIKKEGCQFEYFQAMVLSSFIENKFPLITKFIETDIMKKYENCDRNEILKSTELTCTFFDSLSNPYFSQEFKKELFFKVSNKISKELLTEETLNYIKGREWFFTWKIDNLSQILMKKELRSPY